MGSEGSVSTASTRPFVNGDLRYLAPPPYPFTYIEDVLNRYETKIKSEKHLIYELASDVKDTCYQLSTGFSAARNFMPVVKITNTSHLTNNCITFDERDWDSCTYFLTSSLVKYFENQLSPLSTVKFGEYSMEFGMFMGRKTITITHTNFCTSLLIVENTVRVIINMISLINHRLSVLKGMNFIGCYNNVLDTVKSLCTDCCYNMGNILGEVNLMCDNELNNLNMYCIRECLIFAKEQIFEDFNRL